MHKRKRRSDNSTGFRGVDSRGSKYRAMITIQSKARLNKLL